MSDQVDSPYLYTCYSCGGEFVSSRSEEDALEEKRRLFGDTPKEKCFQVCTDCFRAIMRAMAS